MTTSKGDRPTRSIVVGALAAVVFLAGGLAWYLVRDDDPPEVEAPAPQVVEVDPEVEELPETLLAAPIDYDLAYVIARLEETLPTRFGDIDDRSPHQDSDRVEVAWEAERDALVAEMRGNTAILSTTLTYAGQAWYDPPILPAVRASCGMDPDDPRPRVRIRLRSRIGLDQNFTLRSEVGVDTVEAVTDEDRDRCRITPLGIDVTGTVLAAVTTVIEGRADEIDQEVADVDLRDRLQGVWHKVERPIELTDDVWLQLQPRGLIHGGTRGDGLELTLDVGMLARPLIILGPRPENEPTKLPGLQSGEVPTDALIHLEGRIHYEEAGKRLTRELQDREVELGANLIRIRSIELRGVGAGRVAMEIRFEGSARGRIFLVGRPVLDTVAGELHVPDLEFDLETRNLLVGGLAWIAQDALLEALRDGARIPLEDLLDPLREQFERGLNRDLGDEVSVEGEAGAIRLHRVVALRDYLLVQAEGEARARLQVRQEP